MYHACCTSIIIRIDERELNIHMKVETFTNIVLWLRKCRLKKVKLFCLTAADAAAMLYNDKMP